VALINEQSKLALWATKTDVPINRKNREEPAPPGAYRPSCSSVMPFIADASGGTGNPGINQGREPADNAPSVKLKGPNFHDSMNLGIEPRGFYIKGRKTEPSGEKRASATQS